MTVANVVMFEFDTPEELEGWAQQYGKSGPFPNNIISPYLLRLEILQPLASTLTLMKKLQQLLTSTG